VQLETVEQLEPPAKLESLDVPEAPEPQEEVVRTESQEWLDYQELRENVEWTANLPLLSLELREVLEEMEQQELMDKKDKPDVMESTETVEPPEPQECLGLREIQVFQEPLDVPERKELPELLFQEVTDTPEPPEKMAATVFQEPRESVELMVLSVPPEKTVLEEDLVLMEKTGVLELREPLETQETQEEPV